MFGKMHKIPVAVAHRTGPYCAIWTNEEKPPFPIIPPLQYCQFAILPATKDGKFHYAIWMDRDTLLFGYNRAFSCWSSPPFSNAFEAYDHEAGPKKKRNLS